jgi:hypothetical protein
MKALTYGAILGVLWLWFGLPLAPVAALLPALVQPVILAFAAGLLARPYLARRRWTA